MLRLCSLWCLLGKIHHVHLMLIPTAESGKEMAWTLQFANSEWLHISGKPSLQSYPSCMQEGVPSLRDCSPTDTRYVANDCNESGSSWEVANIGTGAHLHEVGHLLGCPHQESGVMLRDYVTFIRTFLVREPY